MKGQELSGRVWFRIRGLQAGVPSLGLIGLTAFKAFGGLKVFTHH